MLTDRISILYVDDDTLDTRMFARTLKTYGIESPLVTAKDGLEALEILRKGSPSKTLSYPFVILLDINMPRMNGMECLQEIRQDTRLKDSIVFIMTTSSDPEDIDDAVRLKANGYLVKSDLASNFDPLLTLIKKYLPSYTLDQH